MRPLGDAQSSWEMRFFQGNSLVLIQDWWVEGRVRLVPGSAPQGWEGLTMESPSRGWGWWHRHLTLPSGPTFPFPSLILPISLCSQQREHGSPVVVWRNNKVENHLKISQCHNAFMFKLWNTLQQSIRRNGSKCPMWKGALSDGRSKFHSSGRHVCTSETSPQLPHAPISVPTP